jgi:hypothetical protein
MATTTSFIHPETKIDIFDHAGESPDCRVSALQALAAEVVDIERDLTIRREVAEIARTKATEARQRLDAANADVSADEERLDATRQALVLVAGRDRVSDETLEAILGHVRDARP